MTLNILNEHETINKIKEGSSIARFGDGEFIRFILEARGISKLQSFDPILRKKLIEVILYPIKNLLIGIPRSEGKKGWINFFQKKFRKFIYGKELEKNVFASAFFSRPSIVNKSSNEYFHNIQSIWDNRKVVIVNFNSDIIKHCLYDNCKIDFIQISRINCFGGYEKLLDQCKEFSGKNRLFLISAGPTATCLARDLTLLGEQAIDIGQITLEYDLFKKEKNIEKWTSQGTYNKRR